MHGDYATESLLSALQSVHDASSTPEEKALLSHALQWIKRARQQKGDPSRFVDIFVRKNAIEAFKQKMRKITQGEQDRSMYRGTYGMPMVNVPYGKEGMTQEVYERWNQLPSDQRAGSAEQFMISRTRTLLSERKGKEPVVLLDFGGMFSGSFMRIASAFQKELRSGDLVIVVSNLSADKSSIEARLRDEFQNAPVEIARILSVFSLIHYVVSDASELQSLTVQTPKGIVTVSGHVDIVHEQSALSGHGDINEQDFPLLAQALSADGIIMTSHNVVNKEPVIGEKTARFDYTDKTTGAELSSDAILIRSRVRMAQIAMQNLLQSGLKKVEEVTDGVSTYPLTYTLYIKPMAAPFTLTSLLGQNYTINPASVSDDDLSQKRGTIRHVSSVMKISKSQLFWYLLQFSQEYVSGLWHRVFPVNIPPTQSLSSMPPPVKKSELSVLRDKISDIISSCERLGETKTETDLALLGVLGSGTQDYESEQEKRNNQKRISDGSAGKKLISSYHRDLPFSVNHNATNNPNIPNGRFVSKSFWYTDGEIEKNPGLITSTPNQPDERLIKNPANTSVNDFWDTGITNENSTTQSQELSNSIVRKVYAAEKGTVLGSQTGSCPAFIRYTSRISLPILKGLSNALGGVGAGSPPPPPVDEYDKELQDRYKRIAFLAFLASLLRSSDPCSTTADYYDQLKQSLYESTLGFYKSSLSNVYAFDTFMNNNPTLSEAVKRSFGYFGEVKSCQTTGQCVADIWGAMKNSAVDITIGAGLSAVVPSNKPKKELPGNPNYKPYLEIIKKATNEYLKNNPGKKLVAHKTPQKDKIDEKFVLDFMNKPLSDEICEYNESIFCKKPRNSPIDVLIKTPISADFIYQSRFTEYADIGMAFVSYVEKKSPDAGFAMYEAQRKLRFGGGEKIATFVEKMYKESGVPVENHKILEYTLEMNNGNIDDALIDVDSFYKTYRGVGNDHPGLLRHKVLDEFSQGIPWSELKDDHPPMTYSGLFPTRKDYSGKDFDLSWLNQTGQAYHTTNIILLTRFFSPPVVALFTMSQAITYADTQGLAKQITDVTVIKDLYEIDTYLSQFDPNSPRPWPPVCMEKQ
jgi:hypothetical protein